MRGRRKSKWEGNQHGSKDRCYLCLARLSCIGESGRRRDDERICVEGGEMACGRAVGSAGVCFIRFAGFGLGGSIAFAVRLRRS